VFDEIEGVHSVRPGYAGGTLPNPRYEDEHHTYFERNPAAPYCAYVVAPKVSKLRRQFRERLKRKPPPA
jgi:peptide methionine sulfoxide reductase MsrA